MIAVSDPQPEDIERWSTRRSGRRKGREPVELFRSVNVDWLRLKWYFLGFSMIFSVAGVVTMGLNMAQIHSPVPLGVDFQGGTQVRVQFQQTPDVGKIRQATEQAGIKDASVVRFGAASNNEMLISLPEQHERECAGRRPEADL